MVSPESLPSRPLEKEEAAALEGQYGIESVIPFVVDGCTCQTSEVNHVFFKIDGEYVGFDFDDDAEEWRELSRDTSWTEAKDAYVAAAETAH